MGSIGVMMAEWTVELFRSRKKKSKARKEGKKKGKDVAEIKEIADGVCRNCRESHNTHKSSDQGGQTRQITYDEPFKQLEALTQERDRMSKLFIQLNDDLEDDDYDETEARDNTEAGEAKPLSLEDTVRQLIEQTKKTRSALHQSKEDCLRLAEGVGHQLAQRDKEHADRVKSLETLMKEKEKQLMNTSNMLRQQLSDAKREIQMLERKQSSQQQLMARKSSEAQLLLAKKSSEEVAAAVAQAQRASDKPESLEQEVESLRLVLEMRRVEVEQLRSSNNSLLLEMDKCRGLELHVDEQRQRIEEMEAVIQNKNIEIRQLNEQRGRLVQQLEIEESAHLSCQQDLERVEWTLQNVINAKETKKEKSLAYSITC